MMSMENRMGLRLTAGLMVGAQLITLLAVGVAAVAQGASAAPSIQVRGAAVRLTIIPEARGDIAVSLTHADRRLPIRIAKLGDRIFITGDVGHRVHGCRTAAGRPGVAIWGRGAVPYEELPTLIIRAPMTVRLSAGEAVFGEIGRSASVDFTNQGCGDWTIGDVQGRLRLNQAGAGDARTGSAGSSDLSVAGSGGISAGLVRGGLTAVSSGSGAIVVASVFGPVDARVAGPGGITIGGGSVTTMTVSIAGSGAVTLRGVAQSLKASIAGSGDVAVAKVTGPVTKQVFGSGAVRVGR
jgi:hypothetical protein